LESGKASGWQKGLAPSLKGADISDQAGNVHRRTRISGPRNATKISEPVPMAPVPGIKQFLSHRFLAFGRLQAQGGVA
jgi:hypothetical protein